MTTSSCTDCYTKRDENELVPCEGCNGFFCRPLCWKAHWCGELTDRNGRVVSTGDIIQYNANSVYTVVEKLPSFTRNGLCYGERRPNRENVRFILRTRLMEILEHTQE